MDTNAEIQVLKVKMQHAESERKLLLAKMSDVETKLDDIGLLIARYKGFIGATMLIGTTLFAGLKLMWDSFFKG